MENNYQKEEIEIDLGQLFISLLSKWYLIVLAGVSCALIALVITKFLMTPMYTSATSVYVLNKQDSQSVTYSDLQTGTQLTKDYAQLIQSRTVTEQVIANLGLPLTSEQLSKRIQVTSPTDTRILEISVENENPEMAMKIANQVREVAAVHIKDVMDIQAVNIVDEANVPLVKSSPSTTKNVLLGGILGGFVSVLIIVIKVILDDTIKTPDDIESYLGISCIGTIPYTSGSSKKNSKKGRKAVR